MQNKYDPLFRPGRLGSMELKNRIVMAPVNTFHEYLSPELIDFYTERARGGAGMIVMGSRFTMRLDPNAPGIMYLDSDRCIPMLYELADAVHAYGAKICASIGCGFGRNVPPADGSPPVSASALPAAYDPNTICRPLSVYEIQCTADSFAEAAERCRRAGFDAIEIQADKGDLIDQFMSEAWNRRADGYGGSFENRMRFPKEILESVRKGVGSGFPVLFRMAADHKIPKGRGLIESIAIAKYLEEAGADALDIDAGCYGSVDWLFPTRYLGDACTRDLAAAIKKHITVPVLNAGNHTPDTALDALQSGDIDFVMLGRALVADPQWPNRLMEGKPEEIRPCLRCNEFCVKGLYTKRGLVCGVNAQAAREKRFAYAKTNAPKRVAVVGGGLAGLEAARAAADKGHRVTVFEKKERIGGWLAVASLFKTKHALLTWYELQLKKMHVDIKPKTKIAPESEELRDFDEIIIAVGARHRPLPIPGLDGEKVVGVYDTHLTPSRIKGDRIVILGGGMSGVDAAIRVSAGGKQVIILEQHPVIAADAFYVNRVSIYASMAQHKITPLCNHRIVSVTDGGAVAVNREAREVLIEGDTLINALGMLPDEELVHSIKMKYPNARLVGGCAGMQKTGDAIRNGFFAGYSIP